MQETVVKELVQETTKQFIDTRGDHCLRIIDILEGFKEGLIAYKELGICVNMREAMFKRFPNESEHMWCTFNEIYGECIEKWEHYSGDRIYVVPSPCDDMSSNDAYYDNDVDKWDRNTPYGQLRYDLLNFLIKEFKHARDSS